MTKPIYKQPLDDPLPLKPINTIIILLFEICIIAGIILEW